MFSLLQIVPVVPFNLVFAEYVVSYQESVAQVKYIRCSKGQVTVHEQSRAEQVPAGEPVYGVPNVSRVVHHDHHTARSTRGADPSVRRKHDGFVPAASAVARVERIGEWRAHSQDQSTVACGTGGPEIDLSGDGFDFRVDQPEAGPVHGRFKESVSPVFPDHRLVMTVQPGEVFSDGDAAFEIVYGCESIVPLHTVAVRHRHVLSLFGQIPGASPEIRVVDMDPAEVKPGVPGVVIGAVLGDQTAGMGMDGMKTGFGRFLPRKVAGGRVVTGQKLEPGIQFETSIGVDFKAKTA